MIFEEDVCDNHNFMYKDMVSVGTLTYKGITNYSRYVCEKCGLLMFEIEVKSSPREGVKQVGKVVMDKYILEENGCIERLYSNKERDAILEKEVFVNE